MLSVIFSVCYMTHQADTLKQTITITHHFY